MKKGMGLIAGAMALAGLGVQAQIGQSIAVKSANEIQATQATKTKREKLPFTNMGSIPNLGFGGPFGLTPKEYGIAFGNGASRKGRSNKLRYSHNAKLKRRGVC